MMNKCTDQQLSQLQAMNKQVEARISRQHNIDIRNQWMRAKTVKNYQSEYDRTRGHLNDTTMPGITREVILKRKATLESLGAKAFDTIV